MPRYNIAPTQLILAIRQNSNLVREFTLLRWGLIPHWMKKDHIHAGWINARIETAPEKPAFRQAFKQQRCLIVASGFYGWQSLSRNKQPYYITKKDKTPLAIAGLWDYWQDNKGNIIESCAILTTEANAAVKTIHDRMPVILDKCHFTKWLDPNYQDIANLRSLAKPSSTHLIQTYPVGQQINNPRHDIPDCILPTQS